ncbi:hypothetical protein AB0A63_17035 [Lentzea sp. NPDC042327]|uniref:hypothetical protein n=1 Tax=Lentzea sp. NPDC042327 TaxID=3154801 RepID=UPI0034050BC1
MSEQGQAPPPPEPPRNEPPEDRPAADQPTTPHRAPPQPDPAAATPAAAPPPPAPPVTRSRLRGFARHRATQLVAVGLLGLVLGGGIVGAVTANRFDDRGGPGHHRVHDRGERGPDRFDQRGPLDQRGDRFER